MRILIIASIIAVISIASQCVSASILVSSLTRAHSILVTTGKRREAMTTTNEIMKELEDAFEDMAASSGGTSLQAELSKIQRLLKQLKANETAGLSNISHRLIANDIDSLSKQSAQTLIVDSDLPAGALVSLNRVLSLLTASMENMEHGQQSDFEKLRKLTDEAVSSVSYICLLTSFVTGAVAILFAHRVISDINNLQSNTVRLSRRLPLVANKSRIFEIERLNEVIHLADNFVGSRLKSEADAVAKTACLLFSLSQTAQILSVNEYSCLLLGYDVDELQRKTLFNLLVPSELGKVQLMLSAHSMTTALQMICKDGTFIHTEWNNYLRDDDKIDFVAVDITEIVLAEQLKNDFVAMISHDIRSPLSSLALSVTMLSESVNTHNPMRQQLLTSQDEIDHILLTVDDMLNYQKLVDSPVSSNKSAVVLSVLLKSAASSALRGREDSLIHLVPQLLPIEFVSDKNAIRQLLTLSLRYALSLSAEHTIVACSTCNESGPIVIRLVGRAAQHVASEHVTITDLKSLKPGSGLIGTTGIELPTINLITEQLQCKFIGTIDATHYYSLEITFP